MGKVIDFSRAAAKRGLMFRFAEWVYGHECIGIMEGAHPIVLVLFGNDGICMTRETAEKLRDALTFALDKEDAS